MHDVYAYGVIAPSTLLELDDDFPQPAGYAELIEAHPSIGGEAAGTAYVLARLGIRTKLSGNRLGLDQHSGRVIDVLAGAGVDCDAIRRVGDRPSVSEVVVASGDSRTIFGSYRQLLSDRAWDGASRADVRSSRIVCLDPFFYDESLQVVRWCTESEIPYVTVDAPPDSEAARHAAVLIISEEFALRTVATDPDVVLETFTATCQGLVILTQGSNKILSGRYDEEPQEHATIAADVRDTTGAGDSFRAGIIYGLLRGLDTGHLIRTASAVAAYVCEGIPGVLQSPTEAELERFLQSQA